MMPPPRLLYSAKAAEGNCLDEVKDSLRKLLDYVICRQ